MHVKPRHDGDRIAQGAYVQVDLLRPPIGCIR
jgi:hypothetical protein